MVIGTCIVGTEAVRTSDNLAILSSWLEAFLSSWLEAEVNSVDNQLEVTVVRWISLNRHIFQSRSIIPWDWLGIRIIERVVCCF